MYDAIILAGGANGKLADITPQPYEALIEIAGQPMVTYVANALRACGAVDRIFIMGPEEELRRCEFPDRTIVLSGGRTIMETIQTGIEAVGHKQMTLIATADIPLLTADAVNDFLVQCSSMKADLYYPVVTREINERRYPGNKRTYVKLREGTFTGGNIFLVNPDVVARSLRVADQIINNRKNPLKLCKILGWSFVFRFITGTLRLAEVEKRVSELLYLKGAVILSGFPELGIDVDKPSDLELVRAALASGAF